MNKGHIAGARTSSQIATPYGAQEFYAASWPQKNPNCEESKYWRRHKVARPLAIWPNEYITNMAKQVCLSMIDQ